VKSRICILLCIGLWLVPLEARAARWGEAMGIFNIVSPHDSVNVSRVESSFRGLPWWRRRTDHSTDFGASRLESRWRAGAANRVRSEATSGVGPIVDQALYGADGNVLGMARSANTPGPARPWAAFRRSPAPLPSSYPTAQVAGTSAVTLRLWQGSHDPVSLMSWSTGRCRIGIRARLDPPGTSIRQWSWPSPFVTAGFSWVARFG